MRVDRRGFLRIGGASALTALACSTETPSENRSATTGTAPATPGALPIPAAGRRGGQGLHIDFKGLVLLQKQPNAMAVHLVKGEAVSLPKHVPQLWVPAIVIDQTATTKPADSHVVVIGGSEFWLWDLDGMQVTMPPSPTGQPDLTLDETDVGSTQTPANDDGWRPLAFVPDLQALSGATKIVNKDALASSIALTHGHLESSKPTGNVGPMAVWRFKNPGGNVLMERSLTNRVVYSYPTDAQNATITVGDQKIVFQPNANAELNVRNLPPGPTRESCPSPCKPTLKHFMGFFELVDAQFTPTVELAAFVLPERGDVDPDFCPPGRI